MYIYIYRTYLINNSDSSSQNAFYVLQPTASLYTTEPSEIQKKNTQIYTYM